MRKRNPRNIYFVITAAITLLIIIGGISYAYFTAQITGEEDATTITVSGGTLNIIYNGGPNINITNTFPQSDAILSKTFTVTGNNTTELDMPYTVDIIVVSNTFSAGAIKYQLRSTNDQENGTIIPSIPTSQDFGTDSEEILLGNGIFTGPTDGNKIHTYVLDIFFPSTGEDQNINQNKEFNAYIEIS